MAAVRDLPRADPRPVLTAAGPATRNAGGTNGDHMSGPRAGPVTGRARGPGRHERTRRMTTDRYRRPDRAATVQAALCRLQRAERRRTREPHERRGVRGLTLDEGTSLLAK